MMPPQLLYLSTTALCCVVGVLLPSHGGAHAAASLALLASLLLCGYLVRRASSSSSSWCHAMSCHRDALMICIMRSRVACAPPHLSLISYTSSCAPPPFEMMTMTMMTMTMTMTMMGSGMMGSDGSVVVVVMARLTTQHPTPDNQQPTTALCQIAMEGVSGRRRT